MDRNFDISARSLHETFEHLIVCMESHTDFLMGRAIPNYPRDDTSLDGLAKRLTRIAQDFAGFATKVEREGRADEIVVNPNNGNRRSYGGLIAHLITHSMHHRAQILYMFEQLGVQNVIEGDALGWEAEARGWGWEEGGSYGLPVLG